jgi:biopolymer transport protein ExbB/TolQ
MMLKKNNGWKSQAFISNILSVAVLIASIVLVHSFYEFYVHPVATAALQGGSEASRSIFVIIKDMEQEVCFIIMIWCCYLILAKVVPLFSDKGLFTHDFLASFEEKGQFNWPKVLTELENSEYKDKPVLQTWIICIRRYNYTRSVQNASDAMQASVEALAVRLEAGNSMIRYLIWAIPSIGFIGTVRGIGQALAQADEALAGNISGMTDSLGVAFNSTLVALFISIFLMALLHQLQRLQDGLVVDTLAHCEEHLLVRLQTGEPGVQAQDE